MQLIRVELCSHLNPHSILVTNSTFANNSASGGANFTFDGVMYTSVSSFNITSSTFTNNSAAYEGGVMTTSGSSFNILPIALLLTTMQLIEVELCSRLNPHSVLLKAHLLTKVWLHMAESYYNFH